MQSSTTNWMDKVHDFFWMSSSPGKGVMERRHAMLKIPVRSREQQNAKNI